MIKLNIELEPFSVPNYVLVKQKAKPRQEGYPETPKYHLSELSPDTLDQLCNEFRDAVFEKAAKD